MSFKTLGSDEFGELGMRVVGGGEVEDGRLRWGGEREGDCGG